MAQNARTSRRSVTIWSVFILLFGQLCGCVRATDRVGSLGIGGPLPVRGLVADQDGAPTVAWTIKATDLLGSAECPPSVTCVVSLARPVGTDVVYANASAYSPQTRARKSMLAGLDSATGRPRWRSPLQDGEVVCSFVADRPWAVCSVGGGQTTPGRLESVDLATGQARVIGELPAATSTQLRTVGSVVYAITTPPVDGPAVAGPVGVTVARLGDDTGLAWTTTIQATMPTLPARVDVLDDVVYVAGSRTVDGRAVGFHQHTGTPSPGPVGAFFSFADRVVLTRAPDGTVRRPDDSIATFRDEAVNTYDTLTGIPTLFAQITPEGVSEGTIRVEPASGAPSWVSDHTSALGYCFGSLIFARRTKDRGLRLTSLDPESGQVRWESSESLTTATAIACDTRRVIVLDGAVLVALDAATGSQQWRAAVPDGDNLTPPADSRAAPGLLVLTHGQQDRGFAMVR